MFSSSLSGALSDPNSKRPRTGDSKKPAACARCKSLKVKCESKTDRDPCKRCITAGQPCLDTEKRKRRTPPKREHLLNQIRDQAARIQDLMSKLDRLTRHPSLDLDLSSPTLSPTSPELEHHPVNPEVQDWLSKAKQSIDAFGGYIGMGGATVPISLLFKEDPEGVESTDDECDPEDEEAEDGVLVSRVEDPSSDTLGDDSRYEFAVADSDGEDIIPDDCTHPDSPHRPRLRTSHSSGTGPSGSNKREHSPGVRDRPAAIPASTYPFGLMADMLNRKKLMGRKSSEDGSDAAPETDISVANDYFFSPPSPGTEQLANKPAPYILAHNIVTPEEVENLFKIYFDYMNLSLSLLDPVLYTAKKTCYRSAFLFTVICAIASRHYTPRPDLYGQLMHYAQLAAGTALISGRKSVEICIAYILLSLYPVPKQRWDEDHSWIYLGLAIRVAMDINLHHPISAKPKNEQHERELLNRTRIWLNCFNLDRSSGSQHGKPFIIKNTDYIANHSENFWQSSPYNIPNFDIHLCCYNAELRVMADFMAKIYSDPNHPTGLNKDIDLEQLATETDDKLVRLGEKWFAIIATTDMTDPQNVFRTRLLRLAYSYSRLVALSFGFQHVFVKNHTGENPFFNRCLQAASEVVTTIVDDIGRPSQRVYLRHGPEAQSVFLTFAAAFLVKLLQPKFATYLTAEKRLTIRSLVQKTIDLLGSPEVAIDNRHGPKLYSRFLEGLLATPMARSDHSPGALKNTQALPHKKTYRRPKSASSLTPEPERYLEIPLASSTLMAPHYSTMASTSANVPILSMPPVGAANTAPMMMTNGGSPPMGFPLPSQPALSFDHFAPTITGADPFAVRAAKMMSPTTTTTGVNNNNHTMGTHAANAYPPGAFEQHSPPAPPPHDINMLTMNDITMMNMTDIGTMNDLWQSPQVVDDEIWHSMQALAADWQDMSLPGLYWMNNYQSNRSLEPMPFNFAQFPNGTE